MLQPIEYVGITFYLIIMQNKKTSQYFHKSNSSSTYYRSIRYRVNTNIQLSTTIKTEQQNRNRSYFKTINPSMTKDNKCFSTGKTSKFKRYATIENQQSERKYKKMSYLQTWRTLLDKVEFKGADCKIASKGETVLLPSIKQFEQSQFTILDPMNISMDYLKKQLHIAQKQSQRHQSDIKRLKIEMEMMKRYIQGELQLISCKFMEKITRITHFLNIDSIKQQETSLRIKRQCRDLTLEEKQFKTFFQQAKNRVKYVQQEIFQSNPYDPSTNQDQIKGDKQTNL